MSVDHIIVGGGIAGASLAWRLSQEGLNILLIDAGDSASLVATGLINPITGRKIALKHQIKIKMKALEDFYASFKAYLSPQETLKKDILLFRSLSEENLQALHLRLREDKDLRSLVLDLLPKPPASEFISGPGILTQAQHINVKALLTLIKKELKKRKQFQEAYCDFSQLKETNTGWKLGPYECSSLTLTQGWLASLYGPFSFLPFVPAKGELIRVEFEKALSHPEIFFKRYEIFAPLNNKEALFGSTFSWQDLDTKATKKAKEYLQERLKNLINLPFKIKEHVAHVRPATKDRRAFLGEHPLYKKLFIFNGLGSLGLSCAPLYTQQLSQLILKGEGIDQELDVQRYRAFL